MGRRANIIVSILVTLIIISIGLYFVFSKLPLYEAEAKFIIDIFSGLFVSFVFIFLLLKFFRPLFYISPSICKNGNEYIFKFVNYSVYKAVDVKLELFLMEPYNHIGAKNNLKVRNIDLETANFSVINRFRKDYHIKDEFALFAITIRTNVNLQEKLKPRSYLELRLTARHGLTGLVDNFKMKFEQKDVKNDQKFAYAGDLNTIPFDQAL